MRAQVNGMDNGIKRKVIREDRITRTILLVFAILAAVAVVYVKPLPGLLALSIVVPLFLYVGSNRLFTSKRLFETGIKVEGAVTDIQHMHKFGPRYVIGYEYLGKTFNGSCPEFNFSPGTSLSVGQKVTVFLDPKKPESFAISEGSGFRVHA